MNFIKKLLLLIVMQFIAIYSFASTKPSPKPTIWQIVDATPKKTNILDDVVDATNLNDVVEATGRKLDYDRTPVDNKVYKARVNPRIPETKKAIGSTAMKKLLKVSGWGTAAVEGVKFLLEGIDWVMDPEAQSIWRNKPNTQYGCVNYGYKWQQAGQQYNCPIDAAKSLADSICAAYPNSRSNCQVVELYADQYRTKRLSQVSDFTGNRIYVEVSFTYIPTGTTSTNYGSILRGEKLKDYQPEKEILTEDALADYMLGTHKDFQDQKYKDKLPKANTWTGVTQVFKPENRFEEENSPTVRIAQDVLDQSQPESEDVEIKPQPDPETGQTSFKLPSFCSWATTVCEHIKWLQKDDDLDQDIEEPDTSELDREFDTTVNVSGSCPPNPVWDWELMGFQHSTVLPFNMLCTFFGYLSYGLLALSAILSCWMVYHTVTAKSGAV